MNNTISVLQRNFFESKNLLLVFGFCIALFLPICLGFSQSFSHQDIGSVGVAGTTVYSEEDDSFTLQGSGGDIWQYDDAFQFASTPLEGDGEIVARISSCQNTSSSVAKVGLMIRENLSSGSTHAMLIYMPGDAWGLEWRQSQNSSSSFSQGGGATATVSWMKLKRTGTQISAYTSTDGLAWTYFTTINLPMTSTVYAGLAVTSRNNLALAETVFDNVQVQSQADGKGLLAQYFGDRYLQNNLRIRLDSTVNFDWELKSPDSLLGSDNFSVRWSGTVSPDFSEQYTFYTISDDGVRLWVNNTLLIDNWANHGPTENSASISLVANQKYSIRMEFYENGGGAVSKLFWSSPTVSKEIIPALNLRPPLDTDEDGIPDYWESTNGLDPADPLDAVYDADGDGMTNLQEFQNQTNPQDYYNGVTPILNVVSGNYQSAPSNTQLNQPLIVRCLNGNGNPLINAPIRFQIYSGNGFGVNPLGNLEVFPITVRTNSTGYAQLNFKTPQALGPNIVLAKAGEVTAKFWSWTIAVEGQDISKTGMRLWLKANTGLIFNDSGKVSDWFDQSGTNSNAVQTDANSQALIVENAVNGRSVVRFDGVNDHLNLPNMMSGAAEGEMFVVLKATADQSGQRHSFIKMGTDTWVRGYYPNDNGNIWDNFGSTTTHDIGNPGQPLDQYHIYNASSKSGEWAARINGLLQYKVTDNNVSFNTFPQIGFSDYYYWTFFAGDIAEIIVYDRVLTDTERESVEFYLGGKYELAVAPPTPANLKANAISATQIGLQWDYTLGNILTQFVVERKNGIGSFEEIATIKDALSYIDNDLNQGVSYTYRIHALNYVGESGKSNEVVSTTGKGVAMPLDDLKLWLRADAGVTNPVSSWIDQSSSKTNAWRDNSTNQPTLVANAVNGRPAVHFDGSNDYLSLPGVMNGATEGEMFVVLKATADQSGQRHSFMNFGTDTWIRAYYPQDNGNIWDGFGTTVTRDIGNPGQLLNQFHLYNVSSKAGEWAARINGSLQYKTNSNTVSFTASPLIGYSDNYYGTFFAGDIAEILVYNRVLSFGERVSVQHYLSNKYHVLSTNVPAIPANVQAAAISGTQVSITWNYVLGNASTQFAIERKPDGGSFEQIAELTNDSSYIDITTTAASNYEYRIKAINDLGESDFSNIATVNTPSNGTSMPLTGVRLWLKADAGTTNPVSSWTDLRSGTNGWRANGDDQAHVIPDAINGKPVVRFDGNNDALQLPNIMNGATEGEMFVVLKATADQSGQRHSFMTIGTDIYNRAYYPNDNGNIWDSFGSSTSRDIGNPGQVLDQYHIYNACSKSGEWSARINGLLQYKVTENTVSFNTSPIIGFSDNLYGTYFAGDIAEVIIYDHSLNNEERESVEFYLDSKYALSVAPQVPANLKAKAISASQIGVQWDYSMGNTAIQFVLERKAAGGAFTEIAKIRDSSSYIDGSLTAGLTYTYRIRALNSAGESINSSEASSVTGSGVAMPVSDLKLWLRADAGVTNPVSSWTDQSSSQTNAWRNNAENQPTLVENVINGRPSVHFDGFNDFLSLPGILNGVTQAEMFVVLKATADQSGQRRSFMTMGTDIYNRAYYPQDNGNIWDSFGSTLVRDIGNPGQALDQFHLYDASSKNGEWSARINGSLQFKVTENTVSFNPGPLIGYSDNLYGTFFAGDISEVLIYNRVLTTGERTSVQRYLNNKYQILASGLPAVPTNGKGTALSGNQISLSWNYILGNSNTLFIIERRTEGGEFEQIAELTNDSSYIDESALPAINYVYRIKAVNEFGDSAYGEIIPVSTPVAGTAMPLGGIRLWLKADAGTTNPVSSWTDLHNGINGWRANGGEQAQLIQNALNGKPVVRFDGVNDAVQLPNIMSGATEGEMFVVLKATADQSGQRRSFMTMGTDIYSRAYYPQDNGTIWDSFGSNVVRDIGNPDQSLDQYHIYNASSKSGEWSARINGDLQLKSTENTVAFTSAPIIGFSDNLYWTYFAGDIAEVIIYDHVLANAERETVNSYLGLKYGLIQLPATPTNLTAQSVGGSQISLSWQANVTNVSTQYLIERKDEGGSYIRIASIDQAGSYLDSSVSPGHQYYYRVKAANAAGQSGYSNESSIMSATTGPGLLLNGMKLWLKADAGLKPYVSTWKSQCGNGEIGFQADSDSRPSLILNGLNYRPSIHFDGYNDFINLPNVMGNETAGEIFLVLKASLDNYSEYSAVNGTTCKGLMRFGATGVQQEGDSYYPFKQGTISDSFGSTTAHMDIADPVTPLSDAHVFNVTSTATEWTARFNNEICFTTTTNTVGFRPDPILGRGSSYFNSFFAGDIAEVIVYNRALSEVERSGVVAYLHQRHDTPINNYVTGEAPEPPVSLTAIPGNQKVTLSWPIVLGATGYKVQRSTTSGSGYLDFIGNTTNSPTLTLVDSGLTNGTTYYYVVMATNVSGIGSNSAQAAATPVPPPPTPQGLVAVAGDKEIVLSWSSVNGAQGYKLQRSTTSGNGYADFIGNTTIAPRITMTDTGLTNGTTYFYIIAASSTSGLSEASAQVNATPTAAPGTPTDLTATPMDGRVELSWEHTARATGYRIQRSTVSGVGYGDFTGNTTIAPSVILTDAEVTNGTTYFYVVMATNPSGSSDPSIEASATPIALPPGTPVGLNALSGDELIELNWTAVAGATGYKLQRSLDSGNGYADFQGNTVAAPTITLVNNGLNNGVTYFYIVRAIKNNLISLPSTEAKATPGVDVDEDGIPDWWEEEYGISDPLADPDNDGLTNLQEYQQGSTPNLGFEPDSDNSVNLEVFTPLQ